jgi:glycosyltransferase involved in cell wall biosynthesis
MDNRFVILIGSRNNSQWVESNLKSVLTQDYANYKAIYFDDSSEDDTFAKAKQIAGNDSRFMFLTQPTRMLKTWFFCNFTDHFQLENNDILTFLDGDDMFYCENVLSYLNEIYKQTNCWMTYGGMAVWKGGTEVVEPSPQNSEIPFQVIAQKAYRKDTWRTSHLKTMRGFLWNAIDKKDLMPDGKPMVGPDDLAIMFGALELCPPQKVHRVTEPLYLYNHSQENQQSRTFFEQREANINYEAIIRSRKPYDTLSVVCPQLAGGLGNQMFEVAVAASMAKDNGAIAVINPTEHILPNQGRNVNTYLNNVFSRIVTDCNPPTNNHILADKIYYHPLEFKPNIKLRGHFQSYKYFDHNRQYIRDLFAPTLDVEEHIWQNYPVGECPRITAIQVRRGDYVKFPQHHPLLPPEYTAKAVKMTDCEAVWIFSDDTEWCKNNLHFDVPVEYVKDEDYIEMYLMGLCKNLVISNSSFGWWAAYLGSAKVFAPNPWFGPALVAEGFKYDDLVLPDWTVINT